MKNPPPASRWKQVLRIAAYGAVVALAFWGGRLSNPPVVKGLPVNNVKNSHNSTFTDGRTGLPLQALQPGPNANLADLLNAKGKPNADLLAAWAKGLSPAEIAAALQSLQSLPAGLQRDAILAAVVNAWATSDPQGFLAASGNVTVPRLREGGVDDALKTWATDDPKAALDWLKQNPGSASSAALRQRYTAAISGYAANDPQGALTAVASLDANSPADRILRNNALQAVTNTMADSGNYSGALAMFSQLQDPQMQARASNNLIQQWAQSSPEDASAWIATLTDPAQRAQLGARVAQTWAASDPAAAAAWAAQMDQLPNTNPDGSPGQNNSQMLASAIRSWAAYDLDAPAQFLNQLPAGSDKDGAVALYAMQAGQMDPSGAMQWVSSISDDQMRSRAAAMVAIEMSQQDPNAANQFLATTDLLTDQQKQQLQNMPQRMANRIGFALAGGFGGGGTGGQGGGGGGRGNRLTNMILNGGGFFGGGQGQGGGGQPQGNNGGGQAQGGGGGR